MRGFVLLLACLAMPVWADAPSAPTTLEDILRQARERAAEMAAVDRQREARFLAEKARRAELLAQARAALAEEKRRGEALKNRFEENRRTIARLKERLQKEAGDLTELFGVARQGARDSAGLLRDSLVSAQYPERLSALAQVADAKRLPSTQALEGLWLALLEEVAQSGRIDRFQTTVVDAAGEEKTQTVVRVGTFAALLEPGRYLRYLPASTRLVELGRQPARSVQERAAAWLAATADLAPLDIDPTRGALLAVLVHQPGLWARIREGGVVAYLILALGALALLLALERAWVLWRTERRVRAQRGSETARPDNPLGRILAVADEARALDSEALALRLEEAIQKELPRVERGLPTLAILAAVAPLLGLLGTVAGMIDTFQAITLFGTNDPKYLSGGISQALITTELGLVVAIPLLLLHAWLAGRGERIAQVLDQEAAGMVARRAEARGHDG